MRTIIYGYVYNILWFLHFHPRECVVFFSSAADDIEVDVEVHVTGYGGGGIIIRTQNWPENHVLRITEGGVLDRRDVYSISCMVVVL